MCSTCYEEVKCVCFVTFVKNCTASRKRLCKSLWDPTQPVEMRRNVNGLGFSRGWCSRAPDALTYKCFSFVTK